MLKPMMKVFAAGIALFALGIAGCSDTDQNSPLSSGLTRNDAVVLQAASSSVQFQARVATCNLAQRMLTFEGRPDSVIANQNCQIVRLNNGNETPIPFEEIQPGDSAEVQGSQHQNGYVYAHRIAVCDSTNCAYDVAFRDTIATIDYTASAFTVVGRTEVIHVDENTEIWGNVTNRNLQRGDEAPARRGSGGNGQANQAVLAFADLAAGNVVEVRAILQENGDLLAVMIKLANSPQSSTCNQFDAVLASVDANLRTVTFEGLGWNGVVKPGAQLLDVDGSSLTLSDFAAGDAVHVKGIPDSEVENELAICLLQKI